MRTEAVVCFAVSQTRAFVGLLLAIVVASAGSAAAQAPGAPPASGATADVQVGGGVAAATAVQPAPSAETDAPPAESGAPAESERVFDLYHRAYSTMEGSSGGIYLVDPGMAAPGSVRLQFALDAFSDDDFLYENDDVEQDRQNISVSWTAIEMLEIFAAIHNRATVADEPRPNSLHVLGDLTFGFKVGFDLGVFRLGGAARLGLLNDIGESETLLDASTIGLTLLAAADLLKTRDAIPLVIRFNADYLFDNSAEVLDDVEDLRYENLETRANRGDETAHLITRVERFGLGVNRVDMLTVGLGLEAPLQIAERFFLHPIVDYRLGIPINRQDYDCPFFSSDDRRGTDEPGADDTCLDDAGFDAYPMNLAVGVRIVPPVRGLSVLLGADFAFNGDDVFVRELAPQAPFRLLIGIGYDFDARPEAPAPAPAVAAVAAPLPTPPDKARIYGRVTDEQSGAPIPGVIVAFMDPSLTPVATNHEGRFTTYELEPGEVELTLTHPDYESRACSTVLSQTASGNVELECRLAPLARVGTLMGTVRDALGAPIAGVQLQLTGPSIETAVSDATGAVVVTNLAPGEYLLRAVSDAYLARTVKVSVDARRAASFDLALLARPKKPSVDRKGNELQARNLRFVGETAELTPDAALALAEVADLMLRDPAVRLRVQGDGGPALALGRALAIKQRITDAGVPPDRIDVVSEPGKSVSLTIVP